MFSIEQDQFLNQWKLSCIEYNRLDVEDKQELFEVMTTFSHHPLMLKKDSEIQCSP